nr:MAG TPA: hypothetical protein [Caudoviricetes sp.]
MRLTHCPLAVRVVKPLSSYNDLSMPKFSLLLVTYILLSVPVTTISQQFFHT